MSELQALGLGWHSAAFVQLQLADMAHFRAVNAVYNALLPAEDPPGRACIQLPLPGGCLVAVSVTAVCGGDMLADAAGCDAVGSGASSGSWETASDADSDSGSNASNGKPGTTVKQSPGADSGASAAAALSAGSSLGGALAAEPAATAAAAAAANAAATSSTPPQPAADASAAGAAPAAEPAGTAAAASPALQPGRRVLHVQSVSEWAPKCIGPYSQGVAAGGLVFMSGVIPLDPPTMQLISGVAAGWKSSLLARCSTG